MFDAECGQESAFHRAPCARDDFGAQVMCDLNRGHPHATGPGMNKNAFAVTEARDIFQRMPGRQEYHRNCRGFLEGKVARNLPNVAAARSCLGGEAEYRQPEDAITDLDMTHLRTDRLDHASDFVSKDSGVRCFTRIKRERLKHVAKIHGSGFDIDQDFAATTLRRRERNEFQSVKVTALA